MAESATRSVTARLIRGILSLFVVGGVVAAVAAFAYGAQAARVSYDRLLLGAAADIAEAIRIDGGAPVLELPASAFRLLAQAPDDRIAYSVKGPGGVVLTGNSRVSARVPGRGAVFFDGEMQGERARFVTLPRRFAERAFSGTVLVTVGQTMRARDQMAVALTRDALIGAAVIGLALAGLAVAVIGQAMRPLDVLAGRLAARDPRDLTPIDLAVPAEAAGMVAAMNGFMARIERQVAVLRGLISDSAHQLRTPVAAIRVQAELAAEEPDPAQRTAMLHRLAGRSRSLGELLDQMLSRALVIHRGESAVRVRLDLREVALNVIEAGDFAVLAPGLRIELDLTEDEVAVAGDALSLEEAAKNLLANALRHGVAPVRLGVGRRGAEAALWVEDSGPGPAPEMLARLGRRFERNAASKGQSAGLGLSIVREVAEAHGGRLEAGPISGGFRVALILPEAAA